MKTKQMFVLVAVLTALLSHDARAFYSTSAGRWLSRDPIQERGGLSLYVYLRNQSASVVDVLGLFELCGKWCGMDPERP